MALMFGSLGIWEIVFILILGLLVFGPRKLPEISRTIGRTLGELRRSAEDFQRTVEREATDLERSVKPVSRETGKTEARAPKAAEGGQEEAADESEPASDEGPD